MDSEVRHLIEAWHWMYFETDLVLEGIQPENLHRRPGAGLLSISEHLAHLARSEGSIIRRYLLSEADETWQNSILTREIFGWPPTMLENAVEPDLAEMSLAQLTEEFVRLHQECYEAVQRLQLPADHRFADNWDRIVSVRDRLRIAAYHVSYHYGQIYSVRHWLGEATPDN